MAILPEDQVTENVFDLYYEPYKKQIWAVGIGILAISGAFLGVRHVQRTQLNDQWSRYYDALTVQLGGLPNSQDPRAAITQADDLEKLVADYPEHSVTPWAMQGIVQARVAAGQWEEALAQLETLRSSYKDFPLNTLPAGGGDGARSLAEELKARIESEQRWDAQTKYEHRWPSDTRYALVETATGGADSGSFVIGFYDEDSPKHVEAFVERAKNGGFNGTQIYEIRRSATEAPQLFRAGSDASKTERNPAKHDNDDYQTIELEAGRFTLRHQFRVVSAVDMGTGESATRFQVITAPDSFSRYDGENTIFGAVLERDGSIDTIRRIGTAPTYHTNPETATAAGTFSMRDHPYPNIRIRRVSIWKDEALEDGHTWDTSRVRTDQPEPEEESWGADPLPSEFDAAAPGDNSGNDESDADETNEEGADDSSDDATKDGVDESSDGDADSSMEKDPAPADE